MQKGMTRVIPFCACDRDFVDAAVLVKLDPEKSYDAEGNADHEHEDAAKYEADEALLLRSGMGDAEGSYKRFHQKVENAIHSVPRILSGRARLMLKTIPTGCTSLSILYVFLAPSLQPLDWNGYDGDVGGRYGS
jgi:hypothetical protein